MRIANLDGVKPGSILGKPIYMPDGRVLLSAGAALTDNFLSRLREFSIGSIYIEDDISHNIVIDDVVSDRTRLAAKKIVKTILDKQVLNTPKIHNTLSRVVNGIVDDILSNKENLINMIDIKNKDDYTFSHCVNAAVISTVIAVSMGYKLDKLRKICLGALLHDVGKVGVPEQILNKPSKLSAEEVIQMQKHPSIGYDMVRGNIDYYPITKGIILMHHEKSDGSGYPLGLTYDKIHETVRIVSVADIYDAMTSDRIYRTRFSPNDAIEYLVGMTYTWFDERVIKHFRRCVAPYPLGSCVRLSTGDIGIVSKLHNMLPTRPEIRLIKAADGSIYNSECYVDMVKDLTICIVDTVSI